MWHGSARMVSAGADLQKFLSKNLDFFDRVWKLNDARFGTERLNLVGNH